MWDILKKKERKNLSQHGKALKTIGFDTSRNLILNGVVIYHSHGAAFSAARLSASTASILKRQDNRHHFPTQFTDALGGAEAHPALSNAISLPVCLKWKLRVPSLLTPFWLLHSTAPFHFQWKLFKKKNKKKKNKYKRLFPFHQWLLLSFSPSRL